MKAVVIGCGGIGAALARGLVARGCEVYAASRRTPDIPGAVCRQIPDMTDEAALAALAQAAAADGPPQIILVAVGILRADDGLRPEKTLLRQDIESLMRVFRVNAAIPALVAKHFLPLSPGRGRAIFAALSARVGSVSDNRLGGWHSYRASKAALNMLLKNWALERARVNPDSVVVGLHPGTVETPLSRPFISRMPKDGIFSPDDAAARLLAVLDRLSPSDSGRVFDWRGEEVRP